MTDRELDALVAEKVFGWLRFHHPSMPESWISGPGWATARKREGVELGDGGKPLGHMAGVPYYSTTGDGMLAVIEKMRELGFDFRLHGLIDERDGTRAYVAMFLRGNGPFHAPYVRSAPRAVAIAALRALGVEVTL